MHQSARIARTLGLCAALTSYGCSGDSSDKNGATTTDASISDAAPLDDASGSDATVADGGATDAGFDAPADGASDAASDAWDTGLCVPGTDYCKGGATGQPYRCSIGGESETQIDTCAANQNCLNGKCVADTCPQGTTYCVGGSGGHPYTCNQAGDSQTQAATCAANQHCESGACVDDVCPQGTTYCNGGASGHPYTCNATGDAQTQAGTCNGNQYCANGACVAGLCPPSTTYCKGGLTGHPYTCNASGNGEQQAATCAANQHCVNGACVNDVCTQGTSYCVGGTTGQPYACDAAGSNETQTATCASSQHCESGACVSDACPKDTTYCKGGASGHPYTCNAAGTGEVQAATCTANQHCDNGACVADVCTKNTTTCKGGAGGHPYTCNATGTGDVQSATCTAGQFCQGSACVSDLCTQGTTYCVGGLAGHPFTCDATGSSQTQSATCTGGEVCLSGACVASTCSANTSYCVGGETGQPYTCNGSGTAQSQTATCGAGQFCQSGACTNDVCPQGQAFCSGGQPYTCNAAGSASSALPTCKAVETCSGGACVCDPALLTSQTDQGAVRFLYCSVLGRDADASGLAYNAQRLGALTVSRYGLMKELLLSQEFAAIYPTATDKAKAVYRILFHRDPALDPGGVAYWSAQPFETMVNTFLDNAEFFTAQPAALFGACVAKMDSVANSGVDASTFLSDECFRWSPADGVVELAPGRYSVRKKVVVLSARPPLTIRTRGLSGTVRCDQRPAGACAELYAMDDWGYNVGDPGYTWTVSEIYSPGTTLDTLVINGNKSGRYAKWVADGASSTPSVGINFIVSTDNVTIKNSVIQYALRGTGGGPYGVHSGMRLENNLFKENGTHMLHNGFSWWADGCTIGEAVSATVKGNEFVDNTDVQLIFGGCKNCEISYNVMRNTGTATGAAWASLALQSWPDTSGDYTGTDTHHNTIDGWSTESQGGSPKRNTNFGILLGNNAWAGLGSLADPTKVKAFGGTVRDNSVKNAIIGIEIDHLSGPMKVYANTVTSSGGRFTYCSNLTANAGLCHPLWSEAVNVSGPSQAFIQAADGSKNLDFAHTNISYEAVLSIDPGPNPTPIDHNVGAVLWTGAGSSSTPGAVSDNLENLNLKGSNDDKVKALYRIFLSRSADGGGLAYHSGRLTANTATISDIATDFVTGGEFSQKHDLATISNEALVATMYLLALGRTPDKGGFDFWVGKLTGGQPRAAFVAEFLKLSEFTNRF